jgi:hypothetical protein
MTITELIKYFRNNGNKNEFFENNSLDPESEVIEIYMREPFGIEKEIKLFEIEKTGGNLTYIHENIKYQNIIDFYYFMDFIEESKIGKHKYLTNEKLAKIFLNYCINDA